MIHFLDSMLNITMLELSIELSILRSTYALYKPFSKVCVEQCLEALVYMFVTRLTFIKFACIILVHWSVILIICKMTLEQLTSYMQ